ACGGGGGRGGDRVGGGRLLEPRHQVDHGHVGCGHADGHAVQLALERRQHLADGAGGAGRSWNHVQGGGASPAQILVRQIQDALIVGGGVDGGHLAAPEG